MENPPRRPQRALWRALAQLAVGLTHALRGNASGRDNPAAQGCRRHLGPDPDAAPSYGIDIAGLAATGPGRSPPSRRPAASAPRLRAALARFRRAEQTRPA